MVKRILCMLLAALLLLPCAALASNPMVVDDAGLFTVFEIGDMEQIIQRIEAEYQMDIVVLTTYDVPATYSDKIIQDYADMYFTNHNYGMGDDYAGLLYMIDMTNRAPVISTSGVMIDYITDDRLDTLFNVSYDRLASGDYGRAAVALLQYLERFLEEGRLEGSFRYDAETGKRLSGLYNALTSGETMLAAVVGIFVAVMMYGSVSAKYSLKGSTYRYDMDNAQCHFVKDEEQFLNQTRSVMRHPTNTGGTGGRTGGSSGRGSSVHHSSGGRSFGGGVGRRF